MPGLRSHSPVLGLVLGPAGPALSSHTEGLLTDLHVQCATLVKEMRPVLSLAL